MAAPPIDALHLLRAGRVTQGKTKSGGRYGCYGSDQSFNTGFHRAADHGRTTGLYRVNLVLGKSSYYKSDFLFIAELEISPSPLLSWKERFSLKTAARSCSFCEGG